MALQIPDGDGIATLIWSQTGDPDPYTVSFGFGNSTALSANAAATQIRNDWVTDFSAAGNLAVGYTFLGVDVIWNDDGVLKEGTDRNQVVGTLAGAYLPQNNALLAKKSTGKAGRKHRGRSYLPAGYIAEGGVDNVGVILDATRTTLNARLATFLGHLSTHNVEMLLMHNDPGTDPDLVTSYVIEPVIATQRRRLR